MSLDGNEKILVSKIIVLVSALGGSPEDLIPDEVNQDYVHRIVALVDRLEGITGDTMTLHSWRETLPDEVVIGDIQSLIDLAREREAFMAKKIEECIEVVQRYIPPNGIKAEEAMLELVGLLDNPEIVAKFPRFRAINKLPSPKNPPSPYTVMQRF